MNVAVCLSSADCCATPTASGGDVLNLLDEANKIKNTAVWLNDIADDIELEE